MKKELQNVKDIKKQLSICIRYNLIQDGLTAEKLRASIENKDLKNGLKDNLEKSNLRSNIVGPFIHINRKCSIQLDSLTGYGFHFGLSALTRLINLISYYYGLNKFLPSFDLFDVGFFIFGSIKTNSTLGSFYDKADDGMFYLILGFLGYTISFPPLIGNLMIGYARFVFAAGYYLGFPLLNSHMNKINYVKQSV